MNQRIKGLLEQATEFHDYWYKGEGRCIVNYEKFAELIVRECMAMCKTSVGNADYNTGRLHCLENIKEHFGVEE